MIVTWKAAFQFFSKAVFTIALLFSFANMNRSVAEETVINFAVQNSEPKYILLDDGGITGLCGEVYLGLKRELAKKNLTVKIANHTRPIKRILTDLKTGRSDLFCGAGRNAQREVDYIYSIRPVYHTSNVLVTHEDNSFYPKNFADLKKSGVEVGAFLGTTSSEFLKLQTGIQVNDSFTNLDEALDVIAVPDRFRLFYYHDLGLVYLIAKRQLPLRIIPTKFRTVPQWLLYSRLTNNEYIEAVEEAMLRLEITGELADIQSRYTTANQ